MLPMSISMSVKRQLNSIFSNVNPIQKNYLGEPCIKVSELDEPIGEVSKLECHTKPILHRAFSVFIFNTEKRLLLQKRSATKITFPHVWTNSCCSHPLYPNECSGEEGIKIAAERKLLHELGIQDTTEMHVMSRYIYEAMSDRIWVEHELDYAVCVPNFDSPVKPNPEEVSEIRFVSQEQLDEMFQNPTERFSPWFSLFYKFKWLKLWWENLDKLAELKDKSIHKLN